MDMTTEVLYLQTGETSARQDRWLADRIFTEGVSDVGAGQLLVAERATGANMSVDVAPGDGIITGDSIADQGKYQVRETAGVNLPIAAAPASGTRVDLVVLQVHDSTADAGDPANDGAALEVVTGTVDAGAPATPDSALPLATVTVAAGAATVTDADIADLRTQLNAVTLDVGTQAMPLTAAERDALNSPEPGTLVFNTDTGGLEQYDGTVWESVTPADAARIATGTYTGDDASTRVIPLPFTPTFVYVAEDTWYAVYFSAVGVSGDTGAKIGGGTAAADSLEEIAPQPVTNGFRIGSLGNQYETNESGETYRYYALA